jgi:uncharacterized membrane protein
LARARTSHQGSRIHPANAALLASSLPLFFGTLLSDWAYYVTYQVQWINFAAWLIIGALLFAGLALLWTAIESLRPAVPRRRRLPYIFMLATTFAVGFVNALIHGRDGWAAMPEGLILSGLGSLLALASVSIAFSQLGRRA